MEKSVKGLDLNIENDLLKIIFSVILLIIAHFVASDKIRVFVFIAAYVFAGLEVYKEAFEGIKNKDFFDENFLMIIASLGAMTIGQFEEAVSVMVFYSFGEYMEDKAVDSSRDSIKDLLDLKIDYVNVYANGSYEKKLPGQVNIGDKILINPGEKIALDGKIVKGDTTVDQKNLTGESIPIEKNVGDLLMSGSINLDGSIVVKVTKKYEDSTYSKIIELVENSDTGKSKTEKLVKRFAKIYTPVVTLTSVVVAFVMPFVFGGEFKDWIYKALVFLVASCPCAIVLSVPLCYYASISKASKEGILVKGGNYLDNFRFANHFVFDKTGTLTKGEFEIIDIISDDLENTKKYAYIAENRSNHSIAKAITNNFHYNFDNDKITDYKDIRGKGISLKYDNENILVGNHKLLDEYNISYDYSEDATDMFVVVDGKAIGKIVLGDTPKESSKYLIEILKSQNKKITMLTGDNKSASESIANQIGISDYRYSLLPQDKIKFIEDFKKSNDTVVFFGDGVNDAPSLKIADVGISMGAAGEDAAIESSDIVFLNDDMKNVLDLIKITKKLKKIVTQNFVFALSVKLLVLTLNLIGYSSMWAAVFADAGVALLCVLNAIRLMKD